MNEQYKKYITSEVWRKKRIARLIYDHHACAVCGEKRNLEVHHVTYVNFGTEDIYRDLMTLCKKCHARLEEEKKKRPLMEHEKKRNATQMMTVDFCIANEPNDYSGGGKVDLCKNDVVRPILYEYLRERGNDAEYMSVKQVNDYFRDKRYEVIEKLCNENPNINAWQIHEKTGFKYQMVYKFLKRRNRQQEVKE